MTTPIYRGKRMHSNLEILKVLERFFKQNPDQRFNQGLINVGAVVDHTDDYASEPDEILKRIQNTMKSAGLDP